MLLLRCAGNNDVRLAHEECGGVYIMDVDKKNSAYNLYTMDALMGKTLNPGKMWVLKRQPVMHDSVFSRAVLQSGS